ncbi:MAG TPA: carbonic anhydrase [Candidatus Pacearchaeota archaeon]|jgi:carbonic anhydrase|nr:carbonic anhydrase [Candidatus Pacearchaeota archaeon]HQB18367.1 carbonic anhydrase [Candidatus Pacearchaeota archaeon]
MNKHDCQTIVFHCIDFRLINETNDFIKNNYGKCDIVSVAGSSKEIADGNNYLLKQIEISHNLHHSVKVVLIHHSDCGAYKASYRFNDYKEEKEKQVEDMLKTESIIKEKFPDMTVEKVWAELEEGNVSFSKI